jgi:hypothetical protein
MFLMNGLGGLLIGIPTAIGQKLSLYLHFGRRFQGWIRINMVAHIISVASLLLVAIQFGIRGDQQIGILIQTLSLMIPPSLVQAWLLRRYVPNVWLWLLAAVAGTSVFTAIAGQFEMGDTAISLGLGMYGLVTGLSLLWLMGMQGDVGKQKLSSDAENFSQLEDASDEIEQENRLPTLQDSVKSAESN